MKIDKQSAHAVIYPFEDTRLHYDNEGGAYIYNYDGSLVLCIYEAEYGEDFWWTVFDANTYTVLDNMKFSLAGQPTLEKAIQNFLKKSIYADEFDIQQRAASRKCMADFRAEFVPHWDMDYYAIDYKIYQVRNSLLDYLSERDERHPYMFMDWDFANTHGFDFGDYGLVYEGKIKYVNEFESESKILEHIFDKFNLNHPSDFYGHSLSVSDVVEVNGRYFYCNDIGFVEFDPYDNSRIGAASRKTAKTLTLDMMEEHEGAFIGDGVITYIFRFPKGAQLEIHKDWEDSELWEWSLWFNYTCILSGRTQFGTPELALEDFIWGENIGIYKPEYSYYIDDAYAYLDVYEASNKQAGLGDDDEPRIASSKQADYSDKELRLYDNGYEHIATEDKSSGMAQTMADDMNANGYDVKLVNKPGGKVNVWAKSVDNAQSPYNYYFYGPKTASNKNATRHFTEVAFCWPKTADSFVDNEVAKSVETYIRNNDLDPYGYPSDYDAVVDWATKQYELYGKPNTPSKHINDIVEDVLFVLDEHTASNKQATRHFTYAEMQELDDEIEGRELHNSSRLRYTTDCELM